MGGDISNVRVGDLVAAGILTINDGYRMRNAELGSTGTPFVRGGDIGHGWIDHKTVDHIRPEFSERIATKLTKPWDVAFITKGTVGRVGILRPEQPPVVFAPQVAYWRSLDHERLDPRFIYYLLSGAEFQARLDADKTHGAMVADYVSISQQHDFRLSLPEIRAQRAIAHILGTLDDKVELNRRMNATLEAMARALFKSWFVDFDPVRAKAEGRVPSGMDAETAELFPSEFVESELGRIPKGWSVAPLDAVAEFRNGLALQNFRPTDGDPRLPVVKIAQLRTGQADSGEWARADIAPDCVLENGDVVFSWSGSLTVVVWCGGRAALNQHLFRVTSKDYPKWFYLRWLGVHLAEFQRIAGDKATTMGHIQRHHLTAAMCVVPPVPVLQAASGLFGPILERQIALNLASRTLARARDELLPRLLSGELEVLPALAEGSKA
ncbi:MAG: restriction endonuclease subunit S [Polyangiaceae bacterium]|nr:restriction endonuclease subunit S [Polyangiaceae bacterium]